MGIYTDSVLVEIEERLTDIGNIIFGNQDQNSNYSTYFLDLLKKKYNRSSKFYYSYIKKDQINKKEKK